MSYRIEICPNNRAGCKDTVCKANGIKIKKGELRFASWVEFTLPSGESRASWAYKHWGCVSGAQIETLRQICDSGDGEYDYTGIDGYDEMDDHPEVQEKVRRCIQQGHIDPEDFNGDPEKNKPGVKGIHLTAKQKEKRDKDAAAAAGDVSEAEEDNKPKAKAKRGRKKAEDDEEEEEKPQSKKAKTAKGASKTAGAKVKDESDDETLAPPPPRKRKSAAKVKTEDEDDDVAGAAAPKKGRRSSKVKREEESEAEEKGPPPADKRAKKGRKSAVKAPSPEPDGVTPENEDEKPVPKKKGSRASKTAGADEEKPKSRRRSARTSS